MTLVRTGSSLMRAQESLPCYMVNNLARNTEEQCKFIVDNDCLGDEGTFDYVYLVFCQMGLEWRYAAIGLIVFLVILLFLNLSAVADEFLCPSLLTVAKNLRMSDSLAGVTLLAFGNGCPDIFSSLAAASSNRPDLILGELLGAGIFCTSIVAGLVFISTEFKPSTRPLIRDGTFYLLAVSLIWYYCSQKTITFYGSLALGDQFIQSRSSGNYLMSDANTATSNQKRGSISGLMLDENSFMWRRGSQGIVADALNQQKHNNTQQQQQQQKQKTLPATGAPEESTLEMRATPSRSCSCNLTVAVNEKVERREVATQQRPTETKVMQQAKPPTQLEASLPVQCNPHITINDQQEDMRRSMLVLQEYDQFLSHLNPIKSDEWLEANVLGKILQVIRAPLLFVTILTVPVVDLDKINNNWCRLLNTLHCFMIPTALLLVFDPYDQEDDIRPINREGYALLHTLVDADETSAWLKPLIKSLLLIPGILLAVFVYKSTQPFKAPKYHAAFAYAGFVMSIIWIYLLATEMICLLKTVGIMFSMTDTAIGLGVLAWGNSLGDIVANLSLAAAGYPRMALGASIGAPLLNLLLGFGLSFSLKLKPGQSLPVEYTPTVTLLCSTLTLILITLMLSSLIPSGKSRKPFGYLLISGYVVYFLLAVCLECGLIFVSPKV